MTCIVRCSSEAVKQLKGEIEEEPYTTTVDLECRCVYSGVVYSK